MMMRFVLLILISTVAFSERIFRTENTQKTLTLAAPVQNAQNRANVETILNTLMTTHNLGAQFAGIRTDWGGEPNIFNQILTVANTGQQLTDDERKKIIKREVLKELETTRPDDFKAMLTFRKTFPAGFNTAPADQSQELWDATKASIFMQATNADNVASIKENGLDPRRGGQANGAAQTQSVTAVQAQNVAEARGKAYVTKMPAEAKGYYNKDGSSRMILLYICDECGDTATLKLDPDSQTGLYFTSAEPGKMVADRAGANDLFKLAIQRRAKGLPNPSKLSDADVNAFVTAVLDYLVPGTQ